MEEHGMFIEEAVEENKRNEHENYLRMAIEVKKYEFFEKFNKYLYLVSGEKC